MQFNHVFLPARRKEVQDENQESRICNIDRGHHTLWATVRCSSPRHEGHCRPPYDSNPSNTVGSESKVSGGGASSRIFFGDQKCA